jgi:hypothetical protein
MPEMQDYSGPYRHDLRWEDFSKEFLIKLMYAWQRAYLRLSAFWYEAVATRSGMETADSCNLEVWSKVGEKTVSKFAKIGNFELNTVLDSLKLCQLAPDSYVGSELFAGDVDIRNENHVISSTTKCAVLEFFEKAAPDRMQYFCHTLEKATMEKYFNNPRIKVTPLKLPPREGPDDVCCKFEMQIEE